MDLILILLIILIPLIAEIYVKSSYNKNLKEDNQKGLSGFEVAKKILDKNGLDDLYVVEVGGVMSDHYDPKRKVVRLSSQVYRSSSISSMAIAAHEVGHAIQDKEAYAFLKFRSALFPVVNIATRVSYYIILAGFIFGLLDLIYIGIGCTILGLLFQLVTLPVEFDASRRAKIQLEELGLTNSDTLTGVKNVLNAAALTYVAGVIATIAQILRLVLISRRND